MIIYKVEMLIDAHRDRWSVVDNDKSEAAMLRSLKNYRETLSRRKFRLVKHTMEVLDV